MLLEFHFWVGFRISKILSDIHLKMAYLKKNNYDRAERNDLKSRLLLFFPPFSSLLKKGRRKGELIAKIVILSHACLLDQNLHACKILQIINTDLCAGLNIVFPTVYYSQLHTFE